MDVLYGLVFFVLLAALLLLVNGCERLSLRGQRATPRTADTGQSGSANNVTAR